MKMNFLKEWENINGLDYEAITKKVYKAFASWERKNLEIVHGQRERNTEYTFGLPYTSSGCHAGLGLHCNVEAVWKKDKSFVAEEIAITTENEIVVLLMNDEEEVMLIVIGTL